MTVTEQNMAVLKDLMVPMRDGVCLATDVYLPSIDGIHPSEDRFPTLILRTPYDKTMVCAVPPDVAATATHLNPGPCVARGYAVVFQDARSTHASEGRFRPALDEAQDGADTLAWIRKQPWSDGRIAFFGPSYQGGVSIMAATEAPQGLVTAVVQTPNTEQFSNWTYFDGVLSLSNTCQWAILESTDPTTHHTKEDESRTREELLQYTSTPDMGWSFKANFPADAYERLLKTLPLCDLPIVRHVHYWREWIENRDNPAYFSGNAVKEKLDRVKVPTLHLGGWYDLFLRNTYENYEGLTAETAHPEARQGQRLLIGPWSHGDCIDCPPGATVDGHALQLAWMDQHFNGTRHPLFDHPVVLYVMGANRWRAEASWPLPGTERTRYYLHSQGGANSAAGDGRLSTERPQTERPDHYLYDPADPVPSLGGIDLHGGRMAQNEVEARADVLCYTSEVLTEDVEVTGKVSATLFAASSATDTDWWTRLVDVRPDGRADTLSHGVTRARYRSSRTRPEALTPGEIVEYAIDMQATSNVFRKGHRIRVEISSSCYPLGERNPNAFVDLGRATEADFVVASQTVYHDAEHPSSVELPIIPLARDRQWIDPPFPLPSGKHFEFET